MTTTCRPSTPIACENPAMSWDFQVRHYDERGAPGARPEVQRRRRRALSARRDARRLHRAQRDDLHAAARFRLGPTSPRLTGDARGAPRACAATRVASRTAGTRRSGARCAGSASIRPGTAGTAGCAPRSRSRSTRSATRSCVQMVRGTTRTFVGGLATPLASALRWLRGGGDPNARPLGGGSFEGLCYTPLSTRGHRRAGTRERLLDVAAVHRRPPARRARCARDARPPRRCAATHAASPIRKGRRLYRAHAAAQRRRGRGARSARAARGDPVRRRLQHAAAADALGHRPGGASARARHRRCASTCPASARTCRTATKWR